MNVSFVEMGHTRTQIAKKMLSGRAHFAKKKNKFRLCTGF